MNMRHWNINEVGNFSNSIQEQLSEDVLIEEVEEHDLVVINDDYNTFDHVIKTLMKVCGHDQVQAEQCTYIIHYKGKCSVKKGSFEELTPFKQGILDAGIDAVIE